MSQKPVAELTDTELEGERDGYHWFAAQGERAFTDAENARMSEIEREVDRRCQQAEYEKYEALRP